MEEDKANNNDQHKNKHLEHFFCLVGGFLGFVSYSVIKAAMGLESIILAIIAGVVGVMMGLGVYRLGRKLGKMRCFKGVSAILTKDIYLSCNISVDCPQCGCSLKGATREMIGDIGVCPKCKTEFEIKQDQ